LGIQGARVSQVDQLEVYTRPLVDGSLAVVLFNRSPSAGLITVYWDDLNWESNVQADVRDLWAQQDLGTFTGSYSANVNSHAAVMLKIKQQ